MIQSEMRSERKTETMRSLADAAAVAAVIARCNEIFDSPKLKIYIRIFMNETQRRANDEEEEFISVGNFYFIILHSLHVLL
jgi:hypothetical protein